ncbi:ShlB/FhaC/HecB family hemolysin secretion/activation protein [Alloalcanivorax sp. C16-1]|uniref:ShlB/FhaC/HecB family hemolysin secretion/activation protein n=1 Tax=Alloalcanivorax sp. C16-1 TaxID=3390051 RepID=UPI00397109B6
MYDRLQQQEQLRQEQRLEEMRVPGERPAIPAPRPEGAASDHCFPIDHFTLTTPDGDAPPFGAWLAAVLLKWQGRCLSLTDIRGLQSLLTNRLIERGFITSRVLLPEQDIDDGGLTLLVVPGRVEALRGEGISDALLRRAVPLSPGDLLNLRALEQGVENLARLPHLDAEMDLAPGTEQGDTVVLGRADWPRAWQGSLVVNEKHYGDITHGTGQLSLDWGSPFGLADRLSLGLNSDLDREFSDRAWGASLDYDVSLGYWNLAGGYSRQAYQSDVAGIFQRFDSSGITEISRLELTRVLHRSQRTRLSLTLLGAYTRVGNRIEDTTIQVSSYRLRTGGLRLSGKSRVGEVQLAGSLTAERAWAAGPATDLPVGAQVADPIHSRYQLFLSASRFFPDWYGALQVRLNGQYSRDALFPSERLSLASAAAVRGYDSLSVSGNSAAAGTVQFDLYPPLTGPVSLKPFVAWDLGVVPGDRPETEFARLSSTTAGLAVGYRDLQLTTQVSWPLQQHSTEMTDHEYTALASLYVQF